MDTRPVLALTLAIAACAHNPEVVSDEATADPATVEENLRRLTDLEVFMQLLPRSSTAERMNPYTSMWTGVHDGDGPREFHLVLPLEAERV